MCKPIRRINFSKFLLEELYHFNDDGENQQNVSDHDEIKQYLDTRYVCAPEACQRIFGFPMNNMSHAIYRLAVHLEGEQNCISLKVKKKQDYQKILIQR